MYCPKCGAEYEKDIRVCHDCGVELVEFEPGISKSESSENIMETLMNLPVEKWLKWGGLALVLLKILTIIPEYYNIREYSIITKILNTASNSLSSIMNGIFYYSIGIIIELLKGLEKNDI